MLATRVKKIAQVYANIFFLSFPFLSPSFIASLSSDAYSEVFTSWRRNASRNKRWSTVEADLSPRAMLWCIIPKWMVNGFARPPWRRSVFPENYYCGNSHYRGHLRRARHFRSERRSVWRRQMRNATKWRGVICLIDLAVWCELVLIDRVDWPWRN